jgi:chromosome segregation ATPase
MGVSIYSCKFCGTGNVAIRGDDDYPECYWVCGQCNEGSNNTDNLYNEISLLKHEIFKLKSTLTTKEHTISKLHEQIDALKSSRPISVSEYEQLKEKLDIAVANCNKYKSNIEKFTSSLLQGVKPL